MEQTNERCHGVSFSGNIQHPLECFPVKPALENFHNREAGLGWVCPTHSLRAACNPRQFMWEPTYAPHIGSCSFLLSGPAQSQVCSGHSATTKLSLC